MRHHTNQTRDALFELVADDASPLTPAARDMIEGWIIELDNVYRAPLESLKAWMQRNHGAQLETLQVRVGVPYTAAAA